MQKSHVVNQYTRACRRRRAGLQLRHGGYRFRSGFDTLAYAQTLKAAGVENKQAQAHAEAARDSRAGLATGADLDARLASLEARLFCTSWVQGAGLVAVMTALMAAFKLFG